MRIENEDLVSWMQQRRWYATKNALIRSSSHYVTATFPLGPITAHHVVATVETEAGSDRYQLVIGSAERPYVETCVHSDSVIATGDSVYFDVMGDSNVVNYFADLFNQAWQSEDIAFHLSTPLPFPTTARLISTEQSNSSVIFGDHAIAKFYRRLIPGINPDREIGEALDQLDSQFVPRLLGWVDGAIDGIPTTLCVLHQFFSTAVDGFEHALASVRDLIASDLPPSETGGDFYAEATRLGEAVASVHLDLKRAFGVETVNTSLVVAEMLDRLDRAVSEVPALGSWKDKIAERYREIDSRDVPVQRIHGDLHLGQVLRDISGWKILDFEGEPGASLAERRAMGSVFRDVAGMLRSFDYAARQPLISHPDHDRLLVKTSEWADRNRKAFLEGYSSIGDSVISDSVELTSIYELDKAVYEALYEHRFRPDWIEVPLGGIERLMEGR